MKRINRIIIVLFLLILVAVMMNSCQTKREFIYTADIVDQTTTDEAEYSFSVRAVCGQDPCHADVTCNGVLLTSEGDKYTASLRKGENEIEVVVRYGDQQITKKYRIFYKAEFQFSTTLDNAEIRNDTVSFTANAAFNDQPCALVVTHNGELLSQNNETYQTTLVTGGNSFVMTARMGDHIETKEWNLLYEGLELVTDLENLDTGKAEYTFRAAASYGKQLCDLIVSVNGKEITPNGSRYDLLLAVGENHILLTAKHGNITKEWSYTVRYVNSVPNISVGIADGQICRGSVYNFDVVAKDGLGKKLSASQISFSIDWNAEDGADSYVDVTSISKIWDDDTMTSFRIGFGNSAFSSHAGTPFCLKITATDTFGKTSEVVRTMTYVPAAPGEKIGEVVFSMEGFSIGCGYFIEPIRIPVYAGVPFAKTLTDMLTDRGLTYTYTGEIEKGFYLSSVTGLDLTGNRIADGIWDFVKDRGYSRSIPAGASLGEFDFGSGSGWMYSVNGVYKNYGFSDYYPQDGDTVRVQFTVILGEDLGGGGALGGGHGNSLLGDDPNYAPIMKLLAEIANNPSIDKTVYREVIAAVSEWNLSQKAMDEQIQKLKTAYGTKE